MLWKELQMLQFQTVSENNDRISSLNDDLLCRILSLLPTKHAMVTTVLSTRWKDLFASVSDLDLDDSLTCSETFDVTPFCNFVSNVIRALLNKSTCIRKFHLICERGTYEAGLVYSWINTVSLHDLQDVVVYASSLTYRTPFPLQLFKCTTLRVLTLSGRFSLSVPDHVFFPSLRTLKLSDLSLIDDDSVRRFFQGCIVLEELCLLECAIHTISALKVSIASLKLLYLCDMNGDYELLLDAPSLEFFHCSSYATRGYFGDTLKSLVSAHINIQLEDENFGDEEICQLVNMVSNARSLALSCDSLEHLLYQSAKFPNLSKLRVETTYAYGWVSLLNLLDNAPCLEVLCFDDVSGDGHEDFLDEDCCLLDSVPACVSDHLKKVDFGNFHGEEDEFKLVEYFLKNGKVLETMTIAPYVDYFSGGHIIDTQQLIPMSKRLSKFPGSSRACQIVFAGEKIYK